MREQLVIEKPQHQSRTQRIGYRILTFGIWALFLYLIRPLLTICAWFLGFSLFSEAMIEEGGWRALLEVVGWYGGVIACIALLLGGWSLFNFLRFRGNERRRRAPEVSLAEMAWRFDLEPHELIDCRRSKVMEMKHDEKGRIVHIGVLNEVRPASECNPCVAGVLANTR